MVALQVNLEKQEYLQEATKLSDISLYSLMKKKKKVCVFTSGRASNNTIP